MRIIQAYFVMLLSTVESCVQDNCANYLGMQISEGQIIRVTLYYARNVYGQ